MSSSVVIPLTQYNKLSLSYYQICDRVPDLFLRIDSNGQSNGGSIEYERLCRTVQSMLRKINVARIGTVIVFAASLASLLASMIIQTSTIRIVCAVLSAILLLVGVYMAYFVIPNTTRNVFSNIQRFCGEETDRYRNDVYSAESFQLDVKLCDRQASPSPEQFQPSKTKFSSYRTHHNVYLSVTCKNKQYANDDAAFLALESGLLKDTNKNSSSPSSQEYSLEMMFQKKKMIEESDDAFTVATETDDDDEEEEDNMVLYDVSLNDDENEANVTRIDVNGDRKQLKQKSEKKKKKKRSPRGKKPSRHDEQSDLERELRQILEENRVEDGKTKRTKKKKKQQKK